jgi:hypothetical protein
MVVPTECKSTSMPLRRVTDPSPLGTSYGSDSATEETMQFSSPSRNKCSRMACGLDRTGEAWNTA